MTSIATIVGRDAAGARRRPGFGQPRDDRRRGDLRRRVLDPAVAVRGAGVLRAAGAVHAFARGAWRRSCRSWRRRRRRWAATPERRMPAGAAAVTLAAMPAADAAPQRSPRHDCPATASHCGRGAAMISTHCCATPTTRRSRTASATGSRIPTRARTARPSSPANVVDFADPVFAIEIDGEACGGIGARPGKDERRHSGRIRLLARTRTLGPGMDDAHRRRVRALGDAGAGVVPAAGDGAGLQCRFGASAGRKTASSRKACSAARWSSATRCTTCAVRPDAKAQPATMPRKPPSPWAAPPTRVAHARASDAAQRDAASPAASDSVPRRTSRRAELRLYGLNAVRAVFAHRPQAIRKLYLAEARIPQLQPLLKWCVTNRVGYRVVDEADLHKLAASSHHEGVVADVLRVEPVPLTDMAARHCRPDRSARCGWTASAIRTTSARSCARPRISASPRSCCRKHSTLALSGAAARVAEGGAEAVPFVRLGRDDNAIAQLRGAGFALAATVVHGGGGSVRCRVAAASGLRARRRRRGHAIRARRGLRSASVDSRQRRGREPQCRRRDRGVAGAVAAARLSMDPAGQAWRGHAAWAADAALVRAGEHDAGATTAPTATLPGHCSLCACDSMFDWNPERAAERENPGLPPLPLHRTRTRGGRRAARRAGAAA